MTSRSKTTKSATARFAVSSQGKALDQLIEVRRQMDELATLQEALEAKLKKAPATIVGERGTASVYWMVPKAFDFAAAERALGDRRYTRLWKSGKKVMALRIIDNYDD